MGAVKPTTGYGVPAPALCLRTARKNRCSAHVHVQGVWTSGHGMILLFYERVNA